MLIQPYLMPIIHIQHDVGALCRRTRHNLRGNPFYWVRSNNNGLEAIKMNEKRKYITQLFKIRREEQMSKS